MHFVHILLRVFSIPLILHVLFYFLILVYWNYQQVWFGSPYLKYQNTKRIKVSCLFIKNKLIFILHSKNIKEKLQKKIQIFGLNRKTLQELQKKRSLDPTLSSIYTNSWVLFQLKQLEASINFKIKITKLVATSLNQLVLLQLVTITDRLLIRITKWLT